MLSEGRADLVAPLDVDRFIEELSEALPKVAAKGVILRLRATGRDLHAAADREQMRQVFESLVMYGGDVIEGRGTLTIAGRLLPIETDGRYDGNGCLLLSLRCTAAGQGEALFPSEGRGAAAMGRPRLTFSAIRRVIERHHGFFRIFIRRGETDFNVYLPLLRSPFLRAPRAPRSDEQRDYQLFGL
jgi:hypothetical protein